MCKHQNLIITFDSIGIHSWLQENAKNSEEQEEESYSYRRGLEICATLIAISGYIEAKSDYEYFIIFLVLCF